MDPNKPRRPAPIVAVVAVIVVLAIVVIAVVAYALRHKGKKKSRLTITKSSPAYSANEADLLMDSTLSAAATAAEAAGSYYPMMLVTDGGETYQLKLTKDGTTYSFDYLDGLDAAWDWGKGVCHLSVWLAGLASNLQHDANYDWRTNLTTQEQYITSALSDLPSMLDAIDELRGATVTNTSYTTTAPIVINATRAELQAAATDILTKVREFCRKSLSASTAPSSASVTAALDSITNSVTWLMYAVNDVPTSRAVRVFLQWKKLVGKSWDDLYVVISTGVADASSVVTPRGSCITGNTSVELIKYLVTDNTLKYRTILDSSSSLTFDSVESIINPQAISEKIAISMRNSTIYARMLSVDLSTPQNALSTQFTRYSAHAAAMDCDTSGLLGTGCPFAH